MLYLIGLGLSDETDITVKGLEIVKNAVRVYLENYTAVLLCDVKTLVRATQSSLRNSRGSNYVSAHRTNIANRRLTTAAKS